jgi:hypothetical protein
VFFLPPLVSAPNPLGIFDPELTPRVEVCPSDLSDCTGPALLTKTFGNGDDQVRLDAENELYVANWHTGDGDLDPNSTYRIRVWQGSLVLAEADVQITGKGTGRNARSGEVFDLQDGTTLPIKVRIEEGAAANAPAEAGSEDGKAAIEIPAGAVDEYVEITVTPVDPEDPPEPLPPPASGTALPGTIYNFDTGEGELEFNEPVELVLAIPTTLPEGVVPTGLRVYFAGPNGWELLQGEVDLSLGVVKGITTHLSTFAILPADVVTCTDPSALGFATLGEALTAVGPGGTVTVCPGTHVVDVEFVSKGVTIEGQSGSRPTLQTGSGYGLYFRFATGTATIRNLVLQSLGDAGALGGNQYDQVLVEDVDFVSLPGNHAVRMYGGGAGTRVVFQNVTVSGGGDPAFFFPGSGGSDGPFVDVLNSTFNGITPGFSVIQYQNGTTGRIEGNLIDGCERAHCIRVAGGPGGLPPLGEPVRVIGNTVRSTMAGSSQNAIVANAVDFQVRDNVIEGVAAVGDRSDPNIYSYSENGILVGGPTEAGVVSGNQISSANVGLTVDGGTVQVTGLDNTISAVQKGVQVMNAGRMAIHSSDFTDYVIPIGTDDLFGTGDLTCNWWGDTNGPTGVDGGIASDVYWPWGLAPLAGTSATECALEVRVAATDNGSGLPYVGTLAEAASVIAPEGRIYVSDGTHSAEGIVVDRPMTIEADVGASPVIQTNVASAAFFLDGYDSGTVVIDGLNFDFTTPSPGPDGKTTYAIRGSGTYAGLIVRNTNCTVGPSARGGIAVVTSTVPPTVEVENTSIDGGVFAIAAIGVQLDVSNSQFTGGRNRRIQYSASTGRVEGSTFSDCGTAWCGFVAWLGTERWSPVPRESITPLGSCRASREGSSC